MELATISGTDGFNNMLDHYIWELRAEGDAADQIVSVIPVGASLDILWTSFTFKIDYSPVVPGQDAFLLIRCSRGAYLLMDGLYCVGLTPTYYDKRFKVDQPRCRIGKNEISEFLETRLA